MNIVPYIIAILFILVIGSGVIYYLRSKDPHAKAMKEEKARYDAIHDKYKSILDK